MRSRLQSESEDLFHAMERDEIYGIDD